MSARTREAACWKRSASAATSWRSAAASVIGTEAEVPPAFAAAWAQEFFSRVLDGVPLADAAFELARDLVQRDRNLLGLVYALHCDGRSLIRPAIPRA